MTTQKRTLALIILDGWGVSEETQDNAIALAQTPVWDRLWQECPHTLIQGSGEYVGLPDGQMGNSEVGHLNLGAGRVVYQEFTRIEKAVMETGLADNQVLTDALARAKADGKAVHVLGLLSPGGVHSHEEQIFAMLKLAAVNGVPELYMHAFLDGRDTPPRSAKASLERLDAVFAELGHGRTASICGRYYAMDRDKRWDRTERAYRLLRDGNGAYRADNAVEALNMAYQRDENDEFVAPTSICRDGEAPVCIKDGDVVIFMNFRADRARQITQVLIDPDFSEFARGPAPKLGRFVCLTEYKKDFGLPVAFPPATLKNSFGEFVSNHGMKQLRIAETEKYAHVTFFFNGGEERSFEGEDRILIPSPKVATYDLQPEMNAGELTDRLIEAITGGKYDVIICNYANPDMVGHTGKLDAAIKAVETIDACLGRLETAARTSGAELLITADHGNIELMSNPETHQAHTAHTENPVPLLYVGRPARMDPNGGALSDVAPTMLRIMNLKAPEEMEGRPLVTLL